MGIHPEQTKPLTGKDSRAEMFTAALFTTAETRKQPKGPSTDEWIKKVPFHSWILLPQKKNRASLVAQRLKCLPAMQETRVRFLGWEDPPEKEMATHSGILAWRIPSTEKPGGLQSMGSQRVGHDWTTSYLLKKELSNAICSNMDTPIGVHTMPDKHKYHLIPLVCGIWNMLQMNLFTKQTDSQT